MTIDINGTISPSNAEASCCCGDGIGYWNSQESASQRMGSSVQEEKYFLNPGAAFLLSRFNGEQIG
jgi:hypothetical protein